MAYETLNILETEF